MNNLPSFKNNAPISQINITNLVDVALTLVIVLLIISPFIEQGIEVKLPVSSPAKISVQQSVIITVAPKGIYYIENRKVKLRELYNILKEKKHLNPKLSAVIKGDRNVPYGNMIKVLDIAKKCDIESIGLATEVK